ncbi:helix-turn-helix domain-containing protein [Actinacidiphila bryophytorum]|uniref:helix-turn-helix domain-containing protein n=1 Tax=Actinacidiphila bryophytorum TaxID=1436133 RepID=UPI0019618C92|nr:helix-turn-helix domain-containing protein [Actinacidiphila bryophytorum]MBM9438110.1 helix-turn-helix domain-containing protein [Actinacidiphila bryophytorum]MBN6543627.1 helix-turn-helix domain-containing protein [Actinacidiphila bryophytorum]
MAADVGAHSLRMYALGPNPPHVLVVARPARASWPAPVTEATALVSRVRPGHLAGRTRHRCRGTPYRAAVPQMLMSGQVLPAQCAAAPLSIASSALVTACPVDDSQIIILLNPAAARLWAAARLAPLGGAGGPGGRRDLRRADLLKTLRFWLPFGPCGAARVLALHRNTVGSRFGMAGNALGLDLNRLDARMTLDLALRIDSLVEAAPGAEPPAAVPLPEQLRAHLQIWAGDLPARMGDDATGDRLLGVVTNWIDRGLDVSAAAVELGVHDTTVRAALRKAESRLRSPLVSRSRSNGAHPPRAPTASTVSTTSRSRSTSREDAANRSPSADPPACADGEATCGRCQAVGQVWALTHAPAAPRAVPTRAAPVRRRPRDPLLRTLLAPEGLHPCLPPPRAPC